MGKLLFMLLIAAIAWVFFKKRQRPGRSAPDNAAGTGKPASSVSADRAAVSGERMVACGACGVFMPESDSVMKYGKIGCRDPAQCAHRPS